MRTIGICFGSSTMQVVELQVCKEEKTVLAAERISHGGNPGEALLQYLRKRGSTSVDRIAVTGRSFRHALPFTTLSEPNAVECALRELYTEGDYPHFVISSGGETQLVYQLTNSGGIGTVLSGNKCASGTGEFFLQQIRRMGMTIDEAVALATRGVPHRIAGRCSVFCKSDCTHALNKGEPRENVVAGLCLMMADKIADLIKNKQCHHAALIGGGSCNTALVGMLRDRYKRLDVPDMAAHFEAYGAALWAVNNACRALPDNVAIEAAIGSIKQSFGLHKPLAAALPLVDFKESVRSKPQDGDRCILGLDVGSTTTKAVLMRSSDSAIVASVYLRTGGDPIKASRECYRVLHEQLGSVQITIQGLGVTGSGRQIAALHALTECVINEIIAHATAAAHFAPDVDTVFEIGGQDAKYTYLTGGIPSDYAMNEACSAGTGSFLEEAARESLGVATEDIGDAALRGEQPPNFTDQCAAFIGSDIKRAGQEGVSTDDVLAGLVYSICLNYLNRVKGLRPVGKKIFMQGGVCYNRAVPLAMATLMQTPIIVPPEPGLMGAFGVALEVAKRIEQGEVAETAFDLPTLVARDAVRESSFICGGGKEGCDRKCAIARLRLEGKLYSFGGACNKYYNLRLQHEVDTSSLDLVALRQKMLFSEFGVPLVANAVRDPKKQTVGLTRSFLIHSLYPLYSHFFDQLGFTVVMSDDIDKEGIARAESAFCYPAEIAHGSFFNLMGKKPDFIFVPHVMQIPVENVPTYSRTCVFVQGEPYYLQTTFREELERQNITVLAPVLRMDRDYEAGQTAIFAMAATMGIGEKRASEAFAYACERQRAFEHQLQVVGSKALQRLKNEQGTFGMVLFGRPYNSFTSDANMGIPHKIASRSVVVIPYDMLPAAHYKIDEKMFWAMGQKIMKAAQFVKDQPNLFGTYITNFSCGPDSFILGYFQRHMGTKPSLTLELDQHTADAGIDTRIEAALDIMGSTFRRGEILTRKSVFKAAKVVFEKELKVIASNGRKLALTHPDVEVLIPSMGRFSTEGAAAVLRSVGIHARALPVSDKEVLLEGRKRTSCKECLPYILTTGSFMRYISERKDSWKVTLFLMATGGGPCRLGQYCVALGHLIEKNQLENTGILSFTDENGYGGMGSRVLLRAWQAFLVADTMSDIRSMLMVSAADPKTALAELEAIWSEFLVWFEGRLTVSLSTLIASAAARLKKIPLCKSVRTVPVISLIGEIYVRRDEFSRQSIVDYMEQHGFAVRVAPFAEYLCYSNYVINSGLGEKSFTLQEKVKMRLTARIQQWWEGRIKTLFEQSGLYHFEMINVEETITGVKHLLNENFRGETILTVGLGMREILNDSCGIISIGPFGCMPSRMSESMLKQEMHAVGKARMPGWERKAMQYAHMGAFPFLSLETDGSPFPQMVEANLEAFVLQAQRLHECMLEVRGKRERKWRWRGLSVRLYDIMLGNSRANRRAVRR